MYGSEQSDLVVRYYDQVFGISGEAELAWYLGKVQSYGGSVLDLACGTGRLSILIAKAGYEVTAIDHSDGMLNIFKDKLSSLSPEERDRIQIFNQTLTTFNLAKQFNTIICCDAFFHNLTVDDEIKCLELVSRHLKPGGHFVFNLPNPSCDYIQKCEKSAGKIFEERGRFVLGAGLGTLIVEQAQSIDEFNQVIITKLRFSRINDLGELVEKGDSSWVSRYLFRYEAIHLLNRCGFFINSLIGNYRGGEVSKDSQLIFDVSIQ